MHSEIAIEVAAPSRTVFDLASDISKWPDLLPHYRQVTIHSRNDGKVTATMSASRPIWRLGIPVWWRSRQWSDDSRPDDLQLRFSHVAGATRGMEVTWHIKPTPNGCTVSIDHDFSRRLPIIGDDAFPRMVDRLFVRPIAGRTLSTFKRLAEAG